MCVRECVCMCAFFRVCVCVRARARVNLSSKAVCRADVPPVPMGENLSSNPPQNRTLEALAPPHTPPSRPRVLMHDAARFVVLQYYVYT
jgi:hypothetical protein